MRLLIVSPYYAPYSEVGAQRMIGLSEELSCGNDEIVILTYALETLNEICGKRGLCTPIPDNVIIKRVYVNKTRNSSIGQILGYWKEACSLAKAMLKEGNDKSYNLAIVSCGPISTQLGAVLLRKVKGLRYILDIRDLNVLSAHPQKTREPLKNLVRSLYWYFGEYRVEKKCIECADLIVTVTKGCADILRNRYRISSDRIAYIMNGYDDRRLADIEVVHEMKLRGVSIGYFGKLMYYDVEKTKIFLSALAELRKQGYAVEMVHIGPPNCMIDEYIKSENYPTSIYRYMGIMDYADGMHYLASSGVGALYLEYAFATGLGTKLFDYMFLNKPVIFNINIPSEMYEFSKGFQNAFWINDEKMIICAVKKIIEEQLLVLDDNIPIKQFSRKAQNEQYINLVKGRISLKKDDE